VVGVAADADRAAASTPIVIMQVSGQSCGQTTLNCCSGLIPGSARAAGLVHRHQHHLGLGDHHLLAAAGAPSVRPPTSTLTVIESAADPQRRGVEADDVAQEHRLVELHLRIALVT
jgi:hypothetical protein